MAVPITRDSNMKVECPCCHNDTIVTSNKDKCSVCDVEIQVILHENEVPDASESKYCIASIKNFWIVAVCKESQGN